MFSDKKMAIYSVNGLCFAHIQCLELISLFASYPCMIQNVLHIEIFSFFFFDYTYRHFLHPEKKTLSGKENLVLTLLIKEPTRNTCTAACTITSLLGKIDFLH